MPVSLDVNLLVKGALPPLDALREQWRAASLASVWMHADDWFHPAVDSVLEALSHRTPAEPACQDLGFARADAACGIGETIDDLTCLFTTLDRPAPVAAVRALTLGWVDGQATTAPAMSCVDAASGLHTLAHFLVRLREVYDDHGGLLAPSHDLLFVDVGLEKLPSWAQVGRSAGMGRTLTSVFGTGRPVAVLGGGAYVALVDPTSVEEPGEETLARRIERAARDLRIAGLLRRPPRIWREPLPATYEAATTLLMSRRGR